MINRHNLYGRLNTVEMLPETRCSIFLNETPSCNLSDKAQLCLYSQALGLIAVSKKPPLNQRFEINDNQAPGQYIESANRARM